jgi:hypothetical protein
MCDLRSADKPTQFLSGRVLNYPYSLRPPRWSCDTVVWSFCTSASCKPVFELSYAAFPAAGFRKVTIGIFGLKNSRKWAHDSWHVFEWVQSSKMQPAQNSNWIRQILASYTFHSFVNFVTPDVRLEFLTSGLTSLSRQAWRQAVTSGLTWQQRWREYMMCVIAYSP